MKITSATLLHCKINTAVKMNVCLFEVSNVSLKLLSDGFIVPQCWRKNNMFAKLNKLHVYSIFLITSQEIAIKLGHLKATLLGIPSETQLK